jgi:hypothetical protein
MGELHIADDVHAFAIRSALLDGYEECKRLGRERGVEFQEIFGRTAREVDALYATIASILRDQTPPMSLKLSEREVGTIRAGIEILLDEFSDDEFSVRTGVTHEDFESLLSLLP